MTTERVMTTRRWIHGGLLTLALACGLSTQAWGQATTYTSGRTPSIRGEGGDTVLFSVVENAARTGASQSVVLQVVDANTGVVLAQTQGTVGPDAPLRLMYRPSVSGPVYGRAFAPKSGPQLSVALLTVERWNPTRATAFSGPQTCHWELVPIMPEPDRPDGPTTIRVCVPDDPPTPQVRAAP
ncbi:hypothetical protein LXT21_36190 [Myxococcus sp. K38C18041901]|uniref:hypothetical protein n=1 Tax=Myxococcus guangdongensis TaxID=2906760 RepID=UPI0020A7BA43|nr:hypothetical protein [Myxococcus guangdongensis]MCP3064228.1 hypothetical protein [Myxococcus guangdongensis]